MARERGQLKFNKRRIRGFTGNELKIMGLVFMLCDHIGYMLIQNSMLYGYNPEFWNMALATPEGHRLYILSMVLRGIGRMAFPLFAFLLVEGFIHTKNLKAYMNRMLLLALISEVPFDLAVFHRPFEIYYQNICFTFWLGLCTMYFIRKWRKSRIKTALAILFFAGISYLIRSDYSVAGIILISVLYLLRKDPSARTVAGAIISAVESAGYYCLSAAAFIPIAFYNGKRGNLPLKAFFYVFYPLHLMIFYLLVLPGSR